MLSKNITTDKGRADCVRKINPHENVESTRELAFGWLAPVKQDKMEHITKWSIQTWFFCHTGITLNDA